MKKTALLLTLVFAVSASSVFARKKRDEESYMKKWRLNFYLAENENKPGIDQVKFGNLEEVVLPKEEKVWKYEKPFLDRRHYARVESQVNASGIPEISIRLNWRGRNAFKAITARNVGKSMLVYWGDKLVARARIVNAYRYGDIPITGAFDYKTAEKISDKFKYKRRQPRY